MGDEVRATIGVEFCKKLIRFPKDKLCIQLHLWDTAGQERYRSITKQFLFFILKFLFILLIYIFFEDYTKVMTEI